MGKTALIGLLAKAHELRTRLNNGLGAGDDILFDSESGISREDQKEILKEIEKVATQSRISVSPEVFAVRAVKRGILFPIIANIAIVFIAGLAIALSYFLFQQSQTEISTKKQVSTSVESDIIEQMKKDAEAKMQEKNLEIDQIQGRLSEINKEKQDLQSSMDAKVSEREKQLRAAMDAALEAERDKLKKQGLTDEAINQKLGDLEAQKATEFNTQLEAFRKQAEEERRKSEAALKSLEAEFGANLAKANVEKQQALAESTKREEDLRKQLEQEKQAAKTAQATKTQEEQALQSATAQKEKEDFASNQLIGLYEVVKTDITMRDYEKAISSLQAVSSFVSSKEIQELPAIKKRRDFDMFVIESLGTLVKSEIETAAMDTSVLVAATNQISQIRGLVRDADTYMKAGKADEAGKAYGEALQIIPEISRSYAYLVQRDRSEEAGRQLRVREALTKAEAALAAGKPAESLVLYRDAFSNIPETSERVEKTLTNIQSTGLDQGLQKTRQEQTRSAASLVSQADAFNADGSFDDAIPAYLQVLERYPLSDTNKQVSTGIQTAVRGLTSQAAARQKQSEGTLAAEIATLKKEITERQAEVSRIKRSILEIIGDGRDPDTMEMGAVLEALGASYSGLGQDKSASESKLAEDLAAARGEIAQKTAEAKKLTEELAAAREQIAEVKASETKLTEELAAARQQSTMGAASEERLAADLAAASTDIARKEADARKLTEELAAARAEIAQGKAAEKQLSEELAALRESSSQGTASESKLSADLAAAREENSKRAASEAKLAADLAKAGEENKKLLTQIDGLKTELTKAGQAAASQQQAAAQQPLSTVEAQRLKTLTDRFAALDKSYKSYVALEDPIISAKGSEGLVDTKAFLDSFLGSKAVDETFPGLLARIKRYDQEFQSVGRTDALEDVLDIAIAFSKTQAAEEKAKFFDKYLKEYKSDPEMTSLLKQLQQIFK